MFERFAGAVLNKFLSNYFEEPESLQQTSYTGVWSGFLSLQDLRLKVNVVNEKLRAAGHPIEIVCCNIRKVEVTIPWSQLSVMRSGPKRRLDADSQDMVVVVLDGIYLLARFNFNFDDEAMRERDLRKRRKALYEASQLGREENTSSSWKETFKKRFQEGLLPQLADRIQIHLRDLHVRFEEMSDVVDPFAIGLILESLHIHHGLDTAILSQPESSKDGDEKNLIRKVAYFHQLGVYWNAIDCTSRNVPAEHALLCTMDAIEIFRALDRTIARRGVVLSSSPRHRLAPQHTYLLLPVDGHLESCFAYSSGKPQPDSPLLDILILIPDLSFQLRDFQCLQILNVANKWKEHKYVKQYRRFRPLVTVYTDPRAWWFYAMNVIRFELREKRLRWSWGRFRQRFENRKRYCSLYERKLRSTYHSDEAQIESTDGLALSSAEKKELREMDDGIRGDLSVHEVVLYRIFAMRRTGIRDSDATSRRSSWLGRTFDSMMSNDQEVEEEYDRLVDLWEQWAAERPSVTAEASTVVIAVHYKVDCGNLALFSPLRSTSDQVQVRRLQEHFLTMSYEGFEAKLSIMGDFETLRTSVTVANFGIYEPRSSRAIMSRLCSDKSEGPRAPLSDIKAGPFFRVDVWKRPQTIDDFHVHVFVLMHKLEVELVPESEWISRLIALIQPFPKFQSVRKFWSELSFANINSWASDRLGLFTKAMLASEHKKMDVDVTLHCPLIRWFGVGGSQLMVDLGKAVVKTHQLSGVPESRLLSFLSQDKESQINVGPNSSGGNRNLMLDDFSWKTPRRARLDRFQAPDSPTRTADKGSQGPRHRLQHSRTFSESVNFDRSVQLEAENAGFLGGHVKLAAVESTDSFEVVFYDIYEIQLVTGRLTFVPEGEVSSCEFLSSFDCSCRLFLSVLPDDRALPPMKFDVIVKPLEVRLNADAIVRALMIWTGWRSYLSNISLAPEAVTYTRQKAYFVVDEEGRIDGTAQVSQNEPDYDDFDEKGFFDAVENDSYYSGNSDINGQWEVEPNNIELSKDSGGKKSRRGVQRQSSISDVSSLSEGSYSRRRINFHESAYLSAENLAKLDEELPEDIDRDDHVESDAGSFHTAISLTNLVRLANEIQGSINECESNLLNFRQKGPTGRGGDSSDLNSSRSMHVGIEYRRSEAELRALKVAYQDLLDQIAEVQGLDESNGIDPVVTRASESARRATYLATSIKKRTVADGRNVHIMKDVLPKELFQFSAVLGKISLEWNEGKIQSGTKDGSSLFLVMCQAALNLTLNEIESKFRASLEHMSLHRQNAGDHDLVFTAGFASDCQQLILPAVFPNHIPSASCDKQFLRISCQIRKERSLDKKLQLNRIVRAFAAVGDLEILPKANSFTLIHRVLNAFHEIRGSAVYKDIRDNRSSKETLKLDETKQYFDMAVQVSALRSVVFDVDDSPLVALCVYDFRCRTSGAHLDKIQVDVSVANVQGLGIEDFDTGSAFEIFNRSDSYNPLVRLRGRFQRMRSGEMSTWVLFNSDGNNRRADSSTGVSETNHLTDEISLFLSAKVESSELNLSPGTLTLLCRANKALKSLVVNVERHHSKSDGTVGSPSGLGSTWLVIRWRLDFFLGNLLIFTSTSANGPNRVGLSLGMSTVAEPTSEPEKIRIACRIRQFTLDYTIQEHAIISTSPTNVQLVFRVPKQFSKLQMLCHELNGTVFYHEIAPPELDALGKQVDLCLAIQNEIITCKVSAENLASLTEIASELSTVSRMYSANNTNKREEERNSTPKLSSWAVRVTLKELSLATGDSIVGKAAKWNDTVGLTISGIDVAMHDIGSTQFLSAVIDDVNLVDFVFPSGATLFSRFFDPGRDHSQLPFATFSLELGAVGKKRQASLNVVFGSLQVVLVPSVFRSFASFLDVFKKNSKSKQRSPGGQSLAQILSTFATITMSLRANRLEWILPSKDIPKVLRSGDNEPINVVTVRFGLGMVGSLKCIDFDSLVNSWNNGGHSSVISKQGVLRELAGTAGQISTAPMASCDVRVRDFQILRTAIGHYGSSPCRFKVVLPIAGEQRITNAFTFGARHYVVGLANEKGEALGTSSFCSHALHLESEYVDVLVYITQSAGGINDAVNVTLRPILDVFAKSRKGVDKDLDQSPEPRTNLLRDAVMCAPLVLSVEVEGLKVTVLPGGATRLTESPIINFALTGFEFGGATTPMRSFTEHFSFPGMNLHHLFCGAWLRCVLSARYHNRRLVAWEPFIEPWTLNIRLGVDLMKSFGFLPICTAQLGYGKDPHPLGGKIEVPSEVGASRLKDFGRLLRSPFTQETPSSPLDNHESAQFGADLSFLVLLEHAHKLVLPAISIDELKFHDNLPGTAPAKWLSAFGYPESTKFNSLGSAPSVSCQLSDSAHLNVNITGALLETLHMHIKEKGSHDHGKQAPQSIRNESGLTIRFHEILDVERQNKGEKASKFILANGAEVPLSLKRSRSQSCDPHLAYINLELGSFEDIVGRVNSNDIESPKGSRSSLFFYKVSTKIPVDAVGVRRYHLDRCLDLFKDQGATLSTKSDRGLGWVIVRVELRGKFKIVSIESPLALTNKSTSDLLCELRDSSGYSLLWRCLLRRFDDSRMQEVVSVPADIATRAHEASYRFVFSALSDESGYSHESEVAFVHTSNFCRVIPPPPFSQSSFERGIVRERHEKVAVLGEDSEIMPWGQRWISVCGLRIGSFAFEQQTKLSSTTMAVKTPEQRMILFRSPLLFRNYLPFPVAVQVRTKPRENSLTSDKDYLRRDLGTWQDVGAVKCGHHLGWTEVGPSDDLECRVRFISTDGGDSRDFPDWSAPVALYSDPIQVTTSGEEPVSKAKLVDAWQKPLHVLLRFDRAEGIGESQASKSDNIRSYASLVANGSRIVSLFLKFWIVDGTGLDLQYSCGKVIAGQADRRELPNHEWRMEGAAISQGLGELLDDDDLKYLPSRRFFEIFMVGDEGTPKLRVRLRTPRSNPKSGIFSPWSPPIPLAMEDNAYHDSTVQAAHTRSQVKEGDPASFGQSFPIRVRVVPAPSSLGGNLGTRILHVVSRYVVVNEMDREIEICSDAIRSSQFSISSDGRARPFHFDDSSAIQFRPKEFGWMWSGKFKVKSDRREIILRLRHSMKPDKLIANVECHMKRNIGTCLIVFRIMPNAPYRIENNSNYPLKYFQVKRASFGLSERNEKADVILPYHQAEFAWDEPEFGPRSVSLHLADFGNLSNNLDGKFLGCFKMDQISPGAPLKLSLPDLTATILADGPTRVLRISQLSAGRSEGFSGTIIENSIPQNEKSSQICSILISARLSHGISLSVVDFSPKELVHILLEDIMLERNVEGERVSIRASVGSVICDNQLLVTPYPVLFRMGSRSPRRKHRRHQALSLSLRCAYPKQLGYEDLTLLENVDFSIEPCTVSVDGNLAVLCLNMIKRARNLFNDEGNDAVVNWNRDSELIRVLGLPVSRSETENHAFSGTDVQRFNFDDLYYAIDHMASSAIAAKLKSRYIPPSAAAIKSSKHRNEELPAKRQKYYVEKCRISTTSLEVSWSGPLPLGSSFPRWLRPALTFERLPLLWRPFSFAHSYGTADEQLAKVKSHYLNIWRILDLVVGVFAKPTFLVRACLFTWRESMSSLFLSVSNGLKILEYAAQPSELAATSSMTSSPNRHKFLVALLQLKADFLRSMSVAAAMGSSFVRYDSTRYRASSGLVRSRNPRLFANVHGQDLLVDYVEGESAGRSLLSRVRMGLFLGEGYLYHVEDVHIAKFAARAHRLIETDSANLILMLTFDRVLLLNGKLDASFCEIVWDSKVDALLYIEALEDEILQGSRPLRFWYLSSDHNAIHTPKELRYASSIACDTGGLETIESLVMLVPIPSSVALLEKLAATNSPVMKGKPQTA